ncbi:MAG: 30S ribosomal protein S17 [Patescibacteria group bacterium]
MTGIVTSNKMNKALVVTVFSTKLHPKYKKRYKSKKKFTVSCTDSSKFSVGDKVEVVSTRPMSKTISFKVVE